MSVVVIADCDHPSVDIERRRFEAAGLTLRVAQCRTEDDVIAAGDGATGVLAQYAPITIRVMDALPQLRVIGRYGVSLDTVDLAAAAGRGIAVVNVPDYCTSEVSDHALAMILALTRGLVALDRAVQKGVWDFRLGGELRRTEDMQLGIVGLGRIGRALAKRARAVGFRIVGTDPEQSADESVDLLGLDDVLRSSDVISLHLPLNDVTKNLINESSIARMKRGSYLVNTARGGLIDHAALRRALVSGHLGGVALDVLDVEPISPANPLIGLPNVILTPHAAFYSRESLVELKERVSDAMIAALRSRDRHERGRSSFPGA